MTAAEDGRRPIRRALVSVYDKSGLPELLTALGEHGVEIVSTGQTAQLVASLGLPVTRQGALAHPASPQPIGFEEVIEAPPFFMSARQQRLEHESHRVALGKAGLGEHHERRPGFGRADHEAVEA